MLTDDRQQTTDDRQTDCFTPAAHACTRGIMTCIVPTTGSDQGEDVEQSSRYKSCIMTPPNLGDIKLKIEIP